MINGMVKGQIVTRKDWREIADSPYCAMFVIEEQNYIDGEKVTQDFVVYVPKFMEKRIEFFLKDSTRFMTVAFNYMSVVESAKTPGHKLIAVRATQIEV